LHVVGSLRWVSDGGADGFDPGLGTASRLLGDGFSGLGVASFGVMGCACGFGVLGGAGGFGVL